MSERVKLGEEYEDHITGFRGVATGRFEFLHGCVRVMLEGQQDGKPEEFTVDEQRLRTPKGDRPEPTATAGGPNGTPRGAIRRVSR